MPHSTHTPARRCATSAWAAALALALAVYPLGCSAPSASAPATTGPPTLPPPDDSFVLGAAGAPQPLFGRDDSPTFAAGFRALVAAGFNRFVPVFLTSEAGMGSAHLTYFLPPISALSVTPQRSCRGPASAWAALPTALRVDFPTYALVLDQPNTSALAPALVTQRLQQFLHDCLAGDTSKLAAAYLYDEPANNYISSLYDGQAATYHLDNIATLAAASRAVLQRPTLTIEAPLPFMLPHIGVSPGEAQTITPQFWNAVDSVTPHADVYGFDVYPVDLTDDLSVVAEYVRHGIQRAPNATPVMVLQGSGYVDTQIAVASSGRRPSRDETRAMAFHAITAGARGLYWYGQSATTIGDGPLWDSIREVARDVRRISGVFALGAFDIDVGDRRIGVLATHADNTIWIMLANTSGQPIDITLPVPTASDAYDGLTGALFQGHVTTALTLALAPYDARLIALRAR